MWCIDCIERVILLAAHNEIQGGYVRWRPQGGDVDREDKMGFKQEDKIKSHKVRHAELTALFCLGYIMVIFM